MCPAHVHTYECACMGDTHVGERTRASVHTYGHEYEGMCVLHAFTVPTVPTARPYTAVPSLRVTERGKGASKLKLLQDGPE